MVVFQLIISFCFDGFMFHGLQKNLEMPQHQGNLLAELHFLLKKKKI